MKPRIIEITDWHQFSKEVKDLGYKSWIFRGQRSAEWSLECTLWRESKNLSVPRPSRLTRENELLETFKAGAHLFLPRIPDQRETLEWWSLMQHHGAPTRLLDWTYSPYIAAFFGIEHAVKQDFACGPCT